VSPTSGNGDSAWYYKNWCGHPGALQYLDDGLCAKVFPSNFTRDFKCPNVYQTIPSTYSKDLVASLPERNNWVNESAFTNIPYANQVELAMILVKRDLNGRPYFHYVSNGRQANAYETWSSSKVFVVASAAGAMETACSFGLFGSTAKGNHGPTALGDLATVICSYDETAGYSSNSLSKYFSNVGGRSRLQSLVTNWLGASGNASLGGSYGENPPSDLGSVYCDNGPFSPTCANACVMAPDTSAFPPNTLSALGMAEMTRRLALHNDLLPQNQFPQATWVDMQNVLYGASKSGLFGNLTWGGMTADTAIFVQSAVNMTDVAQRSLGYWRIHSKLGAGYSSSRSVGEIVSNNYACFPALDAHGHARVDQGVEFILSARASVPGDTSLAQAEARIQQAIAAAVNLVVTGAVE